MVKTLSEINKEIEETPYSTYMFHEPPKVMSMKDVSKIWYPSEEEVATLEGVLTEIADPSFKTPEFQEQSSLKRFTKGVGMGAEKITQLPQQMVLYGGMGYTAVADLFGNEKQVEIGKEFVRAATELVIEDNKKIESHYAPVSQEEAESFSYALGSGSSQFLSQIATTVATGSPGLGLALNYMWEAGEKTQDRAMQYVDPETGKVDTERMGNIDKDFRAATATGLINTLIEKFTGTPELLSLVKDPLKSTFKKVLGGALEEGVTESGQSLVSIGIDVLDGTIDWKQVPDKINEVLLEGAVGAVLGGTAGIYGAVTHRSAAINTIEEALKGTVPDKDLRAVSTAVYEQGIQDFTGLITTELTLSADLRTKHGEVFDSMVKAVRIAMRESDGYKGMSEQELSQHATEVASKFADDVLAEANKRKTTIDNVIRASKIVARGNKIYLEGVPESVKPKKTASKKKNEVSAYDGTPTEELSIKVDKEVKGDDYIAVGQAKVPVEYKVVEMENLIPSNDAEGNINKAFPQELQNRDRTSIASQEQVLNIANNIIPEKLYRSYDLESGSPIITGNGVVVAGNGRVSSLSKAESLGKKSGYNEFLKSKGFDVEGMKNPVLVRVLPEMDNQSLVSLMEASNTKNILGFSKAEQAINDSAKINESSFIDFNPETDIESASNNEFVKTVFNQIVPENERSQFTNQDGFINNDGYDRIKDALLAYVIKDRATLDRVIGSRDDVVRKATKGLLESAPALVSLEESIKAGNVSPEYSLSDDIQRAFALYEEAKRQKEVSAESYISAPDIFGKYNDTQRKLATMFLETKSANKIASLLKSYVDSAMIEGDLKQTSMFGEKMGKEDILNNVLNANEFFQVAEDMEELDSVNPEYTGETIKVNGKERTVYNSEGQRIAKSFEALMRFYEWFGDSKVVDEQGRPLVVYHGTEEDFDTFDKNKQKKGYYGKGFYFSNNKDFTQHYGSKTLSVYLKIDKPLMNTASKDLRANLEKYKADGYDGTIHTYDDGTITFSVFEPNQIKSTDNRGTFSKESDNIFYQEDALRFGDEGYVADTNSQEFKDWSAGDHIITTEEAKKYEFKSGKPITAVAYHGTKRADRVGNVFLPERATSGPMSFSSSDESIATGYMNTKQDTSIYDETEGDFHKYFKVTVPGYKPTTLDRLWTLLPTKKKEEVRAKAPHITLDYNAENILYDENETRGTGGYNLRSPYGNALEELVDSWLMSGTIWGEEEKFIEVMKLAGLGDYDIQYVDPNAEYPKVYKMYVTMDKPLYTGDIPASIMKKLKTASKKAPKASDQFGADLWDKNTMDPLDWINSLEEDSQGYAWTSIPDWVTDVLKKNGYDGIIDQGGKGDHKFNHTVYIPFYSWQYKDQGNSGLWSRENPNLLYQVKGLPKAEKVKRGSFDVSNKVITLFEDANTSTLPHELAHFWLDNMFTYANSGNASEAYLAQFQAVKSFLNVKEDAKYLTRSQHEKFASAYEKYLYMGQAPDPMIQNVFDHYAKWIRDVYDSIDSIKAEGKKAVKMTPEIIKFFDSMIPGGIDVTEANAKIVEERRKEERIKAVDKSVEETGKVLTEGHDNIVERREKMLPVKTDNRTGYLTAYEKETGKQVEAGSVELKEQQEKADIFVKDNLQDSIDILNGKKAMPEDLLRTALYSATVNELTRQGRIDEVSKLALDHALELRRYGQEISAQRLRYTSVFEKLASPEYWLSRIVENKMSEYADKNNMSVKELDNNIKKSIQAGLSEGKTTKEIIKSVDEDYGLTLFQTGEREIETTFDSKDAAYRYIYNFVNKNATLSDAEALQVTQKADELLRNLYNSRGEEGNPSIEYFKKLSDLEDYANKLTPSKSYRIITDLWSPVALMGSIKTPLFNVIANMPVGLMRLVTRRVLSRQYKSIVSKDLIDSYKRTSKNIYNASGYQISTMNEENPTKTLLGEKIVTVGEDSNKLIKQISKGANLFYKYGLGIEDLFFKDFAFVDKVSLLATEYAKGNQQKADAIFSDATKIEPKTELGKQIREMAQEDALVSTFQNKSSISEASLKIRSAIDKIIPGLGKATIPFAMTPANVIDLGLKNAFGGVYAAVDFFQNKYKLTEKGKEYLAQQIISLVLSGLLVAGIDDDDYMPEYILASSSDRNTARELNIPFNSIRIGDHWVSLDVFGPLAPAMVGLLNMRRLGDLGSAEGWLDGAFGYLVSGLLQSMSIPGIEGSSKIAEKGEQYIQTFRTKGSVETGLNAIYDLLDTVYSRLIPAIVSDISKLSDAFERETDGEVDRILKKIPGARETLPKRVSVTSGQFEKRVSNELERWILDLFVGARIKEQISNPVAEELLRLSQAGHGVSLTTVGKRGELSKLSEEEKEQLRFNFAKEYAKKVRRLISSSSYRRKSDEDKKEAIDKIKRDIVGRLKKKYLPKK